MSEHKLVICSRVYECAETFRRQHDCVHAAPHEHRGSSCLAGVHCQGKDAPCIDVEDMVLLRLQGVRLYDQR